MFMDNKQQERQNYKLHYKLILNINIDENHTNRWGVQKMFEKFSIEIC